MGTGRQGVNQKCGTGRRKESIAPDMGHREARESWNFEGDALTFLLAGAHGMAVGMSRGLSAL